MCAQGSAIEFALDCSSFPDYPFITGSCSSLDCDGKCNGTGAGLLDKPTPVDTIAPEAAPDETRKSNNATIIIVLIAVVALAMASSVPLFVFFMRKKLQLERHVSMQQTLQKEQETRARRKELLDFMVVGDQKTSVQ